MKRVLVTGASGFIGRELCRKLVEQGCEVRGLSSREQSVRGVEMRRADVATELNSGWFAGIDTVFHLAGKAHALSETRADEAEYLRINTDGTRRVLEAAKKSGVHRLIFFSSVKAMSNEATEKKSGATKPLTETDELAPDTPYGKSKLAAERLVLHGGFVPEPVVLRPCMVYGPRAKGNVEKMIRAVQSGRFPPLPETGNKRSMIHVEDVAQAAMLAAQHEKAAGQVFIVSDAEACSTRRMYELIRRALGLSVPRWTVPLNLLGVLALVGDGIGRVRGKRYLFDSDALHKLTGTAWFSSDKIRRELAFTSKWTFTSALPEMVRERS